MSTAERISDAVLLWLDKHDLRRQTQITPNIMKMEPGLHDLTPVIQGVLNETQLVTITQQLPGIPMIVLHAKNGTAFGIKLDEIVGFKDRDGQTVVCSATHNEPIQEALDIAVGRYNAALKEFSR